MTVQFKMVGEKQLRARLTAIGKAPREMLGEIGIRSVEEAKRIHRPHRKTGNLERTIRIGTVTATYVEVRAGGQNKVGYAAAHEFGSKGGQMIRPVRKKALAWGGARRLSGSLRTGAKAEFFSMGHKRGATRPYPYLVPGIEKALKMVGLDGLIKRWNQSA